MPKGMLLRPVVMLAMLDGEESIVVFPRNCEVEIVDQEGYSDVSRCDLNEAAQLLKEAQEEVN